MLLLFCCKRSPAPESVRLAGISDHGNTGNKASKHYGFLKRPFYCHCLSVNNWFGSVVNSQMG